MFLWQNLIFTGTFRSYRQHTVFTSRLVGRVNSPGNRECCRSVSVYANNTYFRPYDITEVFGHMNNLLFMRVYAHHVVAHSYIRARTHTHKKQNYATRHQGLLNQNPLHVWKRNKSDLIHVYYASPNVQKTRPMAD